MKARCRRIDLVVREEKKLKHPKDTRQDHPLLIGYGDEHALIARRPGPNAPTYAGDGKDEWGRYLVRKARR